MSGRVFLIEECNVDVSPAGKYGDICFLFESKESRSSIWTTSFSEDVVRAARKKHFTPHCDFFCIAGGIVPLIQAFHAMLNEYGVLRVLLYDATEQMYVLRVFMTHGQVHEEIAIPNAGRKT